MIFPLLLMLAASALAQVDLVKQQAEINSAKANLEEARQQRDMTVAKRWQEKTRQNEERERLDSQLESRKEKTESALSERSRLFEELRIVREDLNFANEDAEKARAAFSAVFPDQSLVHDLKSLSKGAIPFAIPEVSISGLKDSPLQAVEILLELAKKDISYAAEIEKTDSLIRLGGVGALKIGADSGSFAILLPQEGERGKIFSWQSNLQPEINSAIENAFSGGDDNFFLAPADPLMSTTLGKEMANRSEQKISERFNQYMKDGGLLMYPIYLMLIIALILIAEKFIALLLHGASIKKKLSETLNSPEIRTREDAEKKIEALFAKIIPKLESRLPAISVLGTTAPLMGLLGTVMGMVELFDVITLHGTADPKLLAGGISIALLTTMAGLSVAIPVHLLHTWIAGRVEKAINNMDYDAMSLVNKKFA